MRRLGPLLLAIGLSAIASPAYAGTVPITVTAQQVPVNFCTDGPNPDLSWPFVVQAMSAPGACDAQVAFSAVPATRAADIVSAHAVARLFGLTAGFQLGVLANDGSIAGGVSVPSGDNVVQSNESAAPLRAAGGIVTLLLRSADGTGEAWMSTAATRSLVVSVSDTIAPVIVGPLGTVPANVLLPASLTLGARLTDNGPTVAGATSSINWGDGTGDSVTTIVPANPFTATLVTTGAQHTYFAPGTYTVGIVARDSAGNVRNGTLGTLRVWDVPTSTGTPRVTGRLRRGSRLTCQPGGWTEVGGATPLAYRWLRNGAVISGAEARSYLLRRADRDRKLGCLVIGHNPAGGAASARSASRRFWVKPALRSRPRVTGKPRVGSTLSCTTGGWRWSPQSFRYTWLKNGVAASTHRKRIKLASSDAGKHLACRVMASNAAGRASATTRAVTVKATPKKPGSGGGSNGGCDPSYPGVCIPPPPPDLDCGDIPYRNFAVVGSDPHGFDGDGDGIGCET